MFRLITSTFAACTLAAFVSVSAQEPTPPQPPERGGQERGQAVTLTGCVQQAKTTSGGTAYVLTKVEGGPASMYVLVGADESELASHVSHKVEVTGLVQPTPGGASSAADGGQQQQQQQPARPPLLQVQSVKVVANSCG